MSDLKNPERLTFQDFFIEILRRNTKNNMPKLVIIFSLIKANFSRNNGLFKENLTRSKGNRMTKLGRLFFVLRLNMTLIVL